MINRIRRRSGLLIIVIGGAMVTFILSGLIRQGGCQRQRREEPKVGTIYGKDIPKDEYQQKVDQQVQQLQRRRQEELDEAMKDRIRDRVWRQMVRERLFGKQIDELGIEIPPAEVKDLLAGDNVHPQIRRIFKQQMGSFNKEMVLQQIQRSYQQNEQARKQWTRIANSIIQDRAFTKFTNIVKKAMYANKVEARDAYWAQNRSIDLKFVLKPYRSLPDEEVDLKSSEVKDYYEKHKDDPEYEQEASRAFEYVLVDAGPSQKDIAKARKEMEGLKERFRKEEEDSLFASNQSDRPGAPIEFFRKGELENGRVDSLLFASEPGDVIGPILKEDRFSLYKLLGKETRPDSVRASHILLGRGVRGKTDSLMRVADSLKEELQGGAPFAPMAKRISEDTRSGQKGGSLGWVRPGDMLPAFDSTVFYADTSGYSIVKTRAGVHLIKIEERTKSVRQCRTAVIEDRVSPSDATLEAAYDSAKKVRIQGQKDSSLKAPAQASGLQVRLASRVKESDRSVARIDDSRKLVRWAYNAKKGQVSRPIQCGDHFVVAHLTEVQKEGTPSFENVRDKMRSEVLKDKKAELFKKQMDGGFNLDSLAEAQGLQVRSASDLTFNSNSLPGGGNEPYVIGQLMTVSKDSYTHPIKGNTGVYMALVTDVLKAGDPGKGRLASIKARLQRQKGRRVEQGLFDVLKEKADVDDQRNTLR